MYVIPFFLFYFIHFVGIQLGMALGMDPIFISRETEKNCTNRSKDTVEVDLMKRSNKHIL